MRWQDIEDDREKYQAYLASREWALVKEAVWRRCGGICERCKHHAMDHVHHLTYARKYHERMSDLQGICVGCHEFTHAKRDRDPRDDAPEERATFTLDPIDKEIVHIALNAMELVETIKANVAMDEIRDIRLKAVLQACYEQTNGADGEQFAGRIQRTFSDPDIQQLVAELYFPIDPVPLPDHVERASFESRLEAVFMALNRRRRTERLEAINAKLSRLNDDDNPDECRALRIEYRTLLNERPETRRIRS